MRRVRFGNSCLAVTPRSAFPHFGLHHGRLFSNFPVINRCFEKSDFSSVTIYVTWLYVAENCKLSRKQCDTYIAAREQTQRENRHVNCILFRKYFATIAARCKIYYKFIIKLMFSMSMIIIYHQISIVVRFLSLSQFL